MLTREFTTLQAATSRAMSTATVVIPCYNEEHRLSAAAIEAFFAGEHSHRLLLVDDGSTDGTRALLESLRQAHPARVAVLPLPQNQGKAEAVRQGVLAALSAPSNAAAQRVTAPDVMAPSLTAPSAVSPDAAPPDYVGFWDADLATPLEAIGDFARVLDARPELMMVFGARVGLLGRRIERRLKRHYLGRLFATAVSLMLKLPVYDTQCGAKLFRNTPAVAALFDEPFASRWIFDVELLARWQSLARSRTAPPAEAAVYEYPLDTWRDVAGSKLRSRDMLRAAVELAAIYWRYQRPGAAAYRSPRA